MNVTTTLIDYLDRATDIAWYRNSPKDAPDEYGTVQRDGGASEIVKDEPVVTLMVYAATDGRAESLACDVRDALLRVQWSIDNVFGVSVEGMYNDPLDGKHRHRITATIIVND